MRKKILLVVFALLAVIAAWMYVLPAAMLWVWGLAQTFYAALTVVQGSALVVAIAALVVAWNNFRRGNTAIVKLVKVSNSGQTSAGINNDQLFSKFEVELKNIGIPLRNPSLALNGSTRSGWITLPLQRFHGNKPVTNDGTLEKGMVASYGIRTFEMDATARHMISELVDPEAVNVSVGVYSEGYLVKRFVFRSSGIRRWLKRKWNWLAWTVNEWFVYETIKWGTTYSCRPTILPVFNDPFMRLDHFEKEMKNRNDEKKPNPPRASGQSLFGGVKLLSMK